MSDAMNDLHPPDYDIEHSNRVLLAEDDPVTQGVIKKYIELKGYEVTAVNNGQEAIEAFEENPFDVVITDIYMPELDGRDLIALLKMSTYDPVILVISGETEINTVLDILRTGVYDYLVKPVKQDEIAFKIEKAFELSHIRKLSKKVMKEREILHNQKIDWRKWKDAFLRRGDDRAEANLFTNLKTSLSQSGGFGGVLSLIPLLNKKKSEDEKNYIVNKEIIDILTNQTEIARRTFDQFEQISDIITNHMDLSPTSSVDIFDIFKKAEKNLIEKAEIGAHVIQFAHPAFTPESVQPKYQINAEHFQIVCEELLMNAFRYSEQKSTILIFMDATRQYLNISIRNSPNQNTFGSYGIPEGHEKLVFEPFFRLHATVDERYKTLDVGIGLAKVDHILKKMNASIVAQNVYDQSNLSLGPVLKVQVDIQIPVNH